MGRPYSLDLRERVVASVEGGRSCRETARLFEVSVASVVKWSQRKRRTGSAAASPMGWRNRPLLLAGERAWLLERVAAQPDLTLRAIPGGTGGPRPAGEPQGDLELPAVRAADVQKKACTPPSRTAPTWRAGGRNGRSMKPRLIPRRLVFIDETWAKTNMTRRHGRCRCGDRLVAKIPARALANAHVPGRATLRPHRERRASSMA